mgnify:CR=1 FL=1
MLMDDKEIKIPMLLNRSKLFINPISRIYYIQSYKYYIHHFGNDVKVFH